jgi:hypothetical protein
MEEPIRKEDILDFDGTLTGLRGIIEGFQTLNVTLKKDLVVTVGELTKEVQGYNAATKEGQTSLKNASDAAENLAVQQKALNKLDEETVALRAKLNTLNTDEAKTVAALRVAIQEKTAALKTEAQATNNVAGSINDMRARLKAMISDYNALGSAAAKNAAPGIKKLSDELSKQEEAIGKHQRNVGNYPKLLGQAGGAFTNLASAAGGAAGEISNATTSVIMATGPIGIIVAIVGALALAWKKTQENIDLYLNSADKLALGAAGYEADAEKARIDTRKRASGMIAEGYRLETENMAKLTTFALFYTAEEKKYFAQLVVEGQQMQKNGKELKSQVTGIKDKVDWNIKYNALLQEEEAINDTKLAKETEWEGLEANLVKQRAIVSNQESTSLEKKQAAVEAERIATILVKDKTSFVERELSNVNAIADMTGKQEVYEEKINGLLKEKNTIQKEYYSDQVKINKLNKTADKEVKEGSMSGNEERALKARVAITKGLDKTKSNPIMGGLFTWKVSDQVASVNYKDKVKENLDNIGNIIDAAEEKRTRNQERENRLRENLYEADADAKIRIASGVEEVLSSLAGKSKPLQVAALIASKAIAIAEIIIQTQKANAAITAWGAGLGPVGIVLAEGIKLKNNIAEGINIAAVVAATAAGIAGLKMGHGGSGVVDGPVHASGGVYVPGVGTVEGGEHFSVTSRAMTSRYGASMLDAVSNSINQGKFFEVWANVNKDMGLSDPYTKKMYDLMRNTPTTYLDTEGNTVKEYPTGRKDVIKKFNRN